jgi:N-acylneuraminate cytidylyltransferase
VVSTDSDEIAAASAAAGADVVRRPAALATDTAASEGALLHALDALAATGTVPDVVVFLQCTAPLRRAGELDAAMAYFEAGGYDSLFTAVRTFPFRWRRGADGAMMRTNYAVGDRPMRQAREPEFVETGSFYITRRALLQETGVRLGGRIGCWEQPPLYAIDIDEPEDFALIEAIWPFVTAGPQHP